MVHYQTILPPVDLQPFVRFYWVLESETAYTHQSMASVCPELLFHYEGRFDEIGPDGRQSPSFISGISAPTGQPRNFTIRQSFGLFGLYLYPFAIPLLFDHPASTITHQMVDLIDLWGKRGQILEEQMVLARSTEARINIIESFLYTQLGRKPIPSLPVMEAVRTLLSSQEPLKVHDLAARYYLSERQFARQFLQYTGFNPQAFMRICRFQKAIAFSHQTDWRCQDIAYASGYADPSHFYRDFKAFSGQSPKQFFGKGRYPYLADDA